MDPPTPPPPKRLVALMSRALREDQYSRADADIRDWTDIQVLRVTNLLRR